MRRRTSPLPARAATSPLRKRGQLGAATVPRWSADELSDLRRLAEKKKAGANTTWQAIAEELTRKHGSQRTAQGVMQHYWKKMQKEASTSKRASWIQRQQQTFGWPLLVCCCSVYFAQGFRSLAHMSTQLCYKLFTPHVIINIWAFGTAAWMQHANSHSLRRNGCGDVDVVGRGARSSAQSVQESVEVWMRQGNNRCTMVR